MRTNAERVTALRAARAKKGLRRLEIYAHPDDWEKIKEVGNELQRVRTGGKDRPEIREVAEGLERLCRKFEMDDLRRYLVGRCFAGSAAPVRALPLEDVSVANF